MRQDLASIRVSRELPCGTWHWKAGAVECKQVVELQGVDLKLTHGKARAEVSQAASHTQKGQRASPLSKLTR